MTCSWLGFDAAYPKSLRACLVVRCQMERGSSPAVLCRHELIASGQRNLKSYRSWTTCLLLSLPRKQSRFKGIATDSATDAPCITNLIVWLRLLSGSAFNHFSLQDADSRSELEQDHEHCSCLRSCLCSTSKVIFALGSGFFHLCDWLCDRNVGVLLELSPSPYFHAACMLSLLP